MGLPDVILRSIRLIVFCVLLVIALLTATISNVWVRYAYIATPVEQVTFVSEGVEMAAELVLPKGPGPHPAVFQVSGSGPLGKDHLVPRMHANAPAKRGDVKLAYARVAPFLGYRHFQDYQYRIGFKKFGLSDDEIDEIIEFLHDASEFYQKSVDNPGFYEGPERDALQRRLVSFFERYPEASTAWFGRRIARSRYDDRYVGRIAYSRAYCGCDFLEQIRGVPMFYVFVELHENIDTNAWVAYLEDLKARTGQPIDIYINKGDYHSLNRWR